MAFYDPRETFDDFFIGQVERKVVVLDVYKRQLQRILIHISLCGFDQSLEIAQIEDTSCHTVRMEIFQRCV